MVNINGKEWAALEASDIQSTISEQDFDESFYFEFKDDKVAPKKLMEEVSAFANTFGGYIFLGISDGKQIEGCTTWNEQRIHTTLHDSISPTPSFDVKKFTFDGRIVYIIRIDEGAEPPYITSNGKIYERLSSGSFTIKDSVKLSQIYNKREQLLATMERKISIPPVPEPIRNIYGYIDIGFVLLLSDKDAAYTLFDRTSLVAIAKKASHIMESSNLTYVGDSILYMPGGLSTDSGQLPAHTNNFLEIMADGSAKMRILLCNNDVNDLTVNMLYAGAMLRAYKNVYTYIMGELFPDKLIYAKKYESLAVRKQFHPAVFYDETILEAHPDWQEQNKILLNSLRNHRKALGIATVVTDDRIPKTGLNTLDKRIMDIWGVEYNVTSIIDELFSSRYMALGDATLSEEEQATIDTPD